MSVEVKNQGQESVSEVVAPAQAGGEGAAQGSSGSESTEGTPAAAPAEGSEKSPPGQAAGDAEGEEGAEKPAVVAFKPRDKFRAGDQDHEVPAWLKGALKDEATEKQAIEVLEKAFGLDFVKPKLVETRKERDHFKSEFTKQSQAIGEAREIFLKGDIDLFLDKLAIPHQRMLQWALDKVNYSQLPPEQQRILDERQEAQRNAYLSEKRATSYENQVLEQTRQAKQMLLQAGLERPEVRSFADAYDAKVGKPGSFYEEVRATGANAWIQSDGKVDLTPDQAIEQTLAKWKTFISPAAPAPAAQAQPGTTVVAAAKTAVIPSLQGRAASPMKSAPRSIDDIKKIRDKFAKG